MCEIYSAEVDGIKVAVKVPRKDCEEPAVAEHDLEVCAQRVDTRLILLWMAWYFGVNLLVILSLYLYLVYRRTLLLFL